MEIQRGRKTGRYIAVSAFDVKNVVVLKSSLKNIKHASLWKRFSVWLDMLFVDHGFIRFIYLNKHMITDNVGRMAQPAPHHIKKLAKDGVKTIVNLRGERNCGSYVLERKACQKYGVTLVNFPISSRDMPDKKRLRRAREIFETIEYPAMLHCKSGADRAGLMSTLCLLVHEKRSFEESFKQLSLKYGHVKQAKTGMLDYFFERYASDTAKEPMDFYDWVDDVYDPAALKAEFHENWLAGLIINKILRRE